MFEGFPLCQHRLSLPAKLPQWEQRKSERENERLSRDNERLRQELIERDEKLSEAEKQIADLERKLALRLQNSVTSSKPPSSAGLAGEQRQRGSRKSTPGFAGEASVIALPSAACWAFTYPDGSDAPPG